MEDTGDLAPIVIDLGAADNGDLNESFLSLKTL